MPASSPLLLPDPPHAARPPRSPPGLLPHAGGAASFYRPWARYADPGTELLAVQYPGRENRFREPLVPAMDPLASAVAGELLSLPPLPTVFFGHSMGAAVAYETLLRLEGGGHHPCHPPVCLRPVPRRRRRAAVRTDDEVVEAVRALGGTHAAVWDDPDMRELLLPVIRNDYRLIDGYRRPADAPCCSPTSTPLTGDRDPQVTPEEAAGWSAVTSGSFRLTVLEGDHFYLVPGGGARGPDRHGNGAAPSGLAACPRSGQPAEKSRGLPVMS